jgi:hypothetical protein
LVIILAIYSKLCVMVESSLPYIVSFPSGKTS